MARIQKAYKNNKGEWVLEVLGVPFGGPINGRDADGEYFAKETNTHPDKFGLPPAVYYHGYTAGGQPAGTPEYIGKAVDRWVDEAGIWYRVVLDKTKSLARRVWEAAKKKLAFASSGSITHLVRKRLDGFISEWPVAELSIFDVDEDRQPANSYAVAIPALKAIYKIAGLELPEDINAPDSPGGAIVIAQDENGGALIKTKQKAKTIYKEVNKMPEIMELTEAQLEAEKDKARQELLAEQAAAKKAAEDKQAEIDAAVKSATEAADAKIKEVEEKLAEAEKAANRLSSGEGAPNVAKFANLWKYDNEPTAALAFGIGVLESAGRSGKGRKATEDAYKALAVRIAEDLDKDKRYSRTKAAMKAAGMPFKANELNQSTLASYGDEWVGVTYSTELWDNIAQDTPVVGMIPTVEVPQGSESVTIPVASTPPTFYKVAQATAQDSNPGPTTHTVTTSKNATTNQSLTVAKMGAGTSFTGELVEDSVIPWAGELIDSIVQEGREVLESLVIDGDTETGASTNINDIAGTPASTDYFLVLNGFRKLALVTNTANSRSAGGLTSADFTETLKLMGLAGKNALQKDKVGFILDAWTHWAALEIPEVKTRDVFVSPTIEKGNLTGIYGYKVHHTANMHRWNTDSTYGLKADSAGKIDLDTAANNLYGAILAVRWDQWRFGFKRRLTIETERVPRADTTEITALMRVGMVYRDTEASAISYAVSL